MQMKTMFLLGIVFILLVFFQHSDLWEGANKFLI